MGVNSAIRTLEEFVGTAKRLAQAPGGRLPSVGPVGPSPSPRGAGTLEQCLAEAQRPMLEVLHAIREELGKLSKGAGSGSGSAPVSSGAPGYLTIAEVSLRTGFCTKTVRRWIREEGLVGSRWGGGRELRVHESDLEAFLKSGAGTAGTSGERHSGETDVNASTSQRVQRLLSNLPQRSS